MPRMKGNASDVKDTGEKAGSDRSSSAEAPLISAQRATLVAAVVFALLTALALSEAGDVFELSGPRALAFRLRELVGRAPLLDSRLKVFAFEDRSAHELAFTDLALDDWTAVIEALAARKPRIILFDKTFSHPLGLDTATSFTQRVRAAGTPVVAKAHVSRAPLAFLEPLATTTHTLDLRRLGGGTPAALPWLPESSYRAYGPARGLAPAFSAFGHDENINPHELQPAVSLEGAHQLLHWSLHAAAGRRIERGRLVLDGHEVPINVSGRLPVNLVSFADCLARTRSVSDVLARAKDGRPVEAVNPGDVVVILTDLYTGAVAFEETAIGRIPQGFINLAIVNSVLTGNWLVSSGGTVPLTGIFCLLGALLAMRMVRRGVVTLLFGLGLVQCALGLAAFIYGGLIVPWALPALGFVASGLICNFEVMRAADRRAELLRRDLGGNLSPEKLKRLMRGDARLALEATERVVTVMFIDIVGFSRAAEKQTPKEAFSSLKELISSLRQTVHEFGGDVDRTMGDGMLCVFGNDADSVRHADQAVSCALKIQRENLQRILDAKPGQSVFPVRIGINTAGVYVGNLGDAERVDFTIIGNGVNFGQRLETACDRHMVMIGASTRDLLTSLEDEERMLRKRNIRVKHSEELVEAYEVDPFHATPKLLIEGDEAYRVFIGVERSDTRWPIPLPGLIRVRTNYGDGVMINFSFDGFTIKLPAYYAKDVTLSARMEDQSGDVAERLEQAGLMPMVLEVRWARPTQDGYIHGCMIKNLNHEQRKVIVGILRDCIHRSMALSRSA
jgi:class 3 adenylate cyclase